MTNTILPIIGWSIVIGFIISCFFGYLILRYVLFPKRDEIPRFRQGEDPTIQNMPEFKEYDLTHYHEEYDR